MSVRRSKLRNTVRAVCALLLLLTLLAQPDGLAQAQQQTPATPTPTPQPSAPRVDAGLVRQLQQDGGGQVQIAYHSETGKVRFIGANTPGQPVARARVPASAPPEAAARAFMTAYGPLFGVKDQARELGVKRQKADSGGRSIVRFAQQYNGIPVFAGEVVVHLDKAQNVQVATGELLPDIAVSTTPSISKSQARGSAVAVVAREKHLDAGQLAASDPELQVYNRELIGDPGPNLTQLVWRVEVTTGALAPIRYLVLVDAQSGAIVLKFNQVEEARSRETYTMSHLSDEGFLPGSLLCTEGTLNCGGGDADALAAHTYAGVTYDFYQSRLGRDSVNDAGMTIKSSVHFGVNYRNAFWNGAQMVYGDGFSAGDDVVAHELTHGVTQYESGLLYYRQSGAINESLSDIFGELVDLTDGLGNDAPAVRWLVGEDLSIGSIRNMANPPAFNDPDRMTSPLFWGYNTDNGGVHINSGVGNKAAYLISDGGSFNGKTVTGLGVYKTARIYYEAQTNLLTPGSDYADLYLALQQACFTLVSSDYTTVADCQSVTAAVQATEMNLPPTASGAGSTIAPICGPGQIPTYLFYDDLENSTVTNSSFTHSILTGGPGEEWEYPPSIPYVVTTSGIRNLHGFDRGDTASYVFARDGSTLLPNNAFMRFNHAWSFDTEDLDASTARYWDGAILEYSVDNGTTWLNAQPLISEGGYNGTLVTAAAGSTNPLAGQSAWVGSQSYGATRLNLASLGGQSFRFRFRIGTDSTIGFEGWFVDDIQLYTCASGSTAGINVAPISGLFTSESGGTTTFTVKLNSAPTANVTIALSSSNTNEGTVGPTSLLFTPLNWAEPQTVTVKGVYDLVKDGDVAYTIITAPAVSTDPAYSGLNGPDVGVTNTGACDDRPNVVLSNGSAGPGARLVAVTAGVGLVQSIVFGFTGHPIVNATLDVPGVGNGLITSFTYIVFGPKPTVTFTVHRLAPGGSVMVPMIVTDSCGPWQTFFGSGIGGF
ncbi:MAG: M4 family metallopeptidase [Chloroflexota bacterium]